jgi:rubrerythrin
MDYLLKRFKEESLKEESFDIGEIAMMLVPKLEAKINSLQQSQKQIGANNAALREGLTQIANVEAVTEQKPYGTVKYTPTLESVKKYANEILISDTSNQNLSQKSKTRLVEIDVGDGYAWECSNCKKVWTFEADTPKENNYNFCPNCGQKVDWD